MPRPHNIDTEVNSQYQMRDTVLWGCAAVVAATTAIATYIVQSDVDFPELASLPASTETAGSEPNAIDTSENNIDTASNEELKTNTDNMITGSIRPKNTDKLSPSSVNNGTDSPFGTTIARRQKNADAIRRMRDDTEQVPVSSEPRVSEQDTVIAVNTEIIGPGPIGIDLGTGHSFSILGKRFTAMVNAAPTLFAELSARASIVEHESSIEAHLVVGPLKDVKAAQILCKKIKARVNTPCFPANYTGRKLKLY